ncbi:hypothetical protein GGR52DRAFT_548095 [Hypoxylon sp. FL1284]|nr:hypothetical protein GGR52DRAFT_548095 [Hypoxylon sp. FL1284]
MLKRLAISRLPSLYFSHRWIARVCWGLFCLFSAWHTLPVLAYKAKSRREERPLFRSLISGQLPDWRTGSYTYIRFRCGTRAVPW